MKMDKGYLEVKLQDIIDNIYTMSGEEILRQIGMVLNYAYAADISLTVPNVNAERSNANETSKIRGNRR
jgi:hypothetical protein